MLGSQQTYEGVCFCTKIGLQQLRPDFSQFSKKHKFFSSSLIGGSLKIVVVAFDTVRSIIIYNEFRFLPKVYIYDYRTNFICKKVINCYFSFIYFQKKNKTIQLSFTSSKVSIIFKNLCLILTYFCRNNTHTCYNNH